jgi:hypothetical protein
MPELIGLFSIAISRFFSGNGQPLTAVISN